eukprot:3846812-Pleurochrysis_carterae.AAC.3
MITCAFGEVHMIVEFPLRYPIPLMASCAARTMAAMAAMAAMRPASHASSPLRRLATLTVILALLVFVSPSSAAYSNDYAGRILSRSHSALRTSAMHSDSHATTRLGSYQAGRSAPKSVVDMLTRASSCASLTLRRSEMSGLVGMALTMRPAKTQVQRSLQGACMDATQSAPRGGGGQRTTAEVGSRGQQRRGARGTGRSQARGRSSASRGRAGRGVMERGVAHREGGRGKPSGRARSSERRSKLAALCAAVRASDWGVVNSTLAVSKWDVSEWRAIVQASSQVNDWRGALRLVEEMEAALKPALNATPSAPDSVAAHYAIAACTRAQRLAPALELLDRMRAGGVVPETRSFNMAITCAGRTRKWQLALRLLRSMRGAGVEPTTVSYNSALSALSAAGKWKIALELLDEMKGASNGKDAAASTTSSSTATASASPDVVTFSTVAAACRKGGAWEHALDLLAEMRETEGAHIAPNVFTFTTEISALSDAGASQAIVREQMRPLARAAHSSCVLAAARRGRPLACAA